MEPTPTLIPPPMPKLPGLTPESFWQMTAIFGTLFADILAIFSIIGSSLILLIGIVNFISKKKILRTTEGIAQWSIMGLFVGIPSIYAVFITKTDFMGLIIHDKITVALLLLASLLMLFLRILIEIIKTTTHRA